MKIWLVTLFENTPVDDNQNTRYNSIAREAIKRGHDVVFWSCTFRHNVKKQRYSEDKTIQVNPKLRIEFVRSISYKKNIGLRRLYAHHDTGKRLVRRFDAIEEKPDIILNAFPPVSVALHVSKWAEAKEIPYVLDIIDPWPDVFVKHFNSSTSKVVNTLVTPMRRNVRITIRRSAAITAISNEYLDWSRKYGDGQKPVYCFYPAIDLQAANIGQQNTSIPSFRVIYAGSLGYSYDIPTILHTAESIEKKVGDKISFVIAGDGPQRALVEKYAKEHSNLVFLGRISKENLSKEYALASIGLTQHVEGATQSVTYKLFDLLGAGLPIMNSLESEMKDIILENGVGLHNEPGNVMQLTENIMRCYEDNELLTKMQNETGRVAEKFGDSRKVYSKFISLLEQEAQLAENSNSL